MRIDVVLALTGNVFTLADGKDRRPAFRLKLTNGLRTVVRILVNEPLTQAELADSIETFEECITTPSGQLALSTAYAFRRNDSAAADVDDWDVVTETVKIPKGTYHASVHATIAGPAVPLILGDEPLAAYFKRTHNSGAAEPAWLKSEPGSEDFWVGLIVHLQKIPQPIPSTGKLFACGKNARKPVTCPSGILSHQPVGWERYVQTGLHYTHNIAKLVANLSLTPLAGGPATIAVSEVILPYWIAWICGETHPSLEIVCDRSFKPEWPGFRKGVQETRLENGWRVDFEGSNARWSQFRQLRQIGGLLEGLPSGARLTLNCACDRGGVKSRQRYAGRVCDGKWIIDSTYPAMDAARLGDMLELVRQAETGCEVHARDDAEAVRLEKRLKKDDLLSDSPPKRRGLDFRLSAKQRDDNLMPFLISCAFRTRYPKGCS